METLLELMQNINKSPSRRICKTIKSLLFPSQRQEAHKSLTRPPQVGESGK